MDSSALVEMFDYVREHSVRVHSVQIVRRGRLVLDAYFSPYSSGMKHDVASVTKSVTSTLVGLAIDRGYLRDVNQSVAGLFPDRAPADSDSRRRKLALEHLLTMRAGWDCGSDMSNPNINYDGRLAEMRRTTDWLQFALNMPMSAEPGTRFAYCNAACHLLSVIITQVTGTNAFAFARRELFEPIGIHDLAWPADPHGNNHGWSDLQMHPRDMAKLGQLFLQRGKWNGRQVVPEGWIRNATRSHVESTGNKDHYGYLWWVPGEAFPGVFEAVGRGGQRIIIWPAKDLVLVFTGGGFDPDDLTGFILKALKSDRPLPENVQASKQLANRIARAAEAPSPKPVPKPPAMAARISGKMFALSANTLGLTALALKFNATSEAQAEVVWNGRHDKYGLGLDSVGRLSTNTLVNLPAACKGRWLDEETFLLSLDLVGGINDYELKLKFSKEGRHLNVTLRERTGLNDEAFEGDEKPI